MKKAKSSKSKKLFVKKESEDMVQDLIQPEADLIPAEADKSGAKDTAPAALPEEREMSLKTRTGPLTGGDTSQQDFADENTILIKRTLRSGQCIQFDGNVVVMGDVNPGSEIVASGNIVVMGALRGVVHAGATGNEKATVSAFKLQPTQLRIANHITRAPDGDYPKPEHPETAKIRDGVVVIEVYQLAQDRQTKIC